MIKYGTNIRLTIRLTNIWSLVFCCLALSATVIAFLIVGQSQVESDTLWHIKAGQWALEHGIPQTDPFSWTMRGKEWMAHEWLWEVCAAWVYNNFGYKGIWLFNCLWISLFCGALWILLRQRCAMHHATLLYVFAVIASSLYWDTRPHPMAQALFACTILILTNCKSKPGLMLLLPVIILIWANVHGSAPLGVLLIILYWLITVRDINLPWSNIQMERLNTKGSKLLFITALVSFGTSIINPQGIHLWTYMWNVSNHPLMTKYILEWQSPNFHNIYEWPLLILSLCLFCFLAVKNKNKISLFEFVLMCGFFFLSMKQSRHAPYFYFTSVLVIGILLSKSNYQAIKIRGLHKSALAVFFLATFILCSWIKPPTWINEDKRFFPIAATEYLLEHDLQNNLFNAYGYGGYLIWQDISPFIDGRADLYTFNSDIFSDYFKFESSPQQYLDKYNIQTVIVNSQSSMDLYLTNHPNWAGVFRNKSTVIYIRK